MPGLWLQCPYCFSCKERGISPSCNTRRMVETAAHLVDEVFPQVPVRQWVLSFPKRLRYFLSGDSDLLNCVLRIFLNSVEKALQSCSPNAPDHAVMATKITVICDNARYYRSKQVKAYLEDARIKLMFLPPYAPNLNLIERYWKYFKKNILYNHYFETFKEFKWALYGFL